MFSGFIEGIGTAIGDLGEHLLGWLLPDSFIEGFKDAIDSLFSVIAHPFDSIADAATACIDGVCGVWKKAKKWLPSWLGGYSDEELKQLEAEEEAKKKIEEKKENAAVAQKQIESFTPQQKVDYDFSQFGATTNSVDLRNISVPTVNLPQMPTLPAPAMPDVGNLYDASNLLQLPEPPAAGPLRDASNLMQLPELPSPDKFQDAFSALETAGSNLRTVNLAAAGASSMVQTTNDNHSAFNTTSTNTSVKVDGITINAQTDSPDKLGQAVMNTLNNYTNYGLDASTSVAGL